MGLFDELKAYVTNATESPVDTDAEYVRHRAQASFDNSPTGTEIRKISKAEALKPTETGTLPTGDVDLQTGKKPGELPEVTPSMQQQAVQDKEAGRQQKLQASMDKAPVQPPVGLDAILAGLDYPASKVRGAIAAHISKQTGAKVTEANLAEYVGKATAPGDPVGQVVNTLLTGLVTDPLNYLPVIGIPATAYKSVGQAAVKGAKAVADISKGAGVDLTAETGSISTRMLTGGTFYSPTERVIEAKVPNVATPDQVTRTLANSGISLDEAKWMDLDTFMAGKATVTKPELLEYVKSHQIEVKEVQLDNKSVKDSTGSFREMGSAELPKFGAHTLPGGTNYRELLLTLPNNEKTRLIDASVAARNAGNFAESGKLYNEAYTNKHWADFTSSHFPEERNILVHVRTNDRIDSEGKRVLFIEEVQSDWGQAARAGKDVPAMPFAKTDQWSSLAIKRVLRLAAEEGYERIAWTTGAQQAERYDLSKYVQKVYATKFNDDYRISALTDSEGMHDFGRVPEAKLAETIGKELADKIKQQELGKEVDYSGLDLKVGGEGMKGFYDEILPRFVNKYAKKWGGRVDTTTFSTDNAPDDVVARYADQPDHPFTKRQNTVVHSLTFTPEMTNAVINNPQSLMGSVFQTVDEHLRTLPKMMLDKLRTDEKGSASVTASLALTRTILGALAGGVAGDEENAVRNAIIGAGLGAVMSPKAIASILSKVKGLGKGAKPLESGAQATPTSASKTATTAPETTVPLDATHFQRTYQQLVETARRGVRHDPDVKAEGDLLVDVGAISQESVKSLYPGTTLNDAQTYALHTVLTQSGKQVLEMAAQVSDDATMQAFLTAFYTHGTMLDPKRLGVEAEAGRTLRMYGTDAPLDVQAMQKFLDQFSDVMGTMKEGMSPTRLVEMVKQLQTPEQLATFTKNAIKPGLTDAVMSLWVNSLLSGPHTHAANILGNGATLAWSIGERQVAGLMGGEVRPGEAVAMVKGVFESFGDALKLFGKAWKQNEPVQGATKLDRPRVTFQAAGVTGIPGQALDYLSSAFEAAGGRTLMATDEFFKAIAFRAEVRARSLRDAYDVVNHEGLKGKQATAKVHELNEKYLVDVPADIAKSAEQFAAYVTFTKNLGPTGQWIQEGAAKHAAVKLVVPFVRAPLNIFKFAGERTPLSLLTKSMWTELRAGGSRAELATAKLATGAMIAGIGTMWAANGVITGGGPNARKFKEVVDSAKEDGWQPYSVNVSALKRQALGKDTAWLKGDKLIAYNRVEPLGMLLGLYANYTEIVSNTETDEGYEELANTLLMATVKTMASKTFIKGLSQTALAFAYPDEFLGDTVTRQGVGFVPIVGSSLSRQVARTVDPVLRDAEGFVEEVMKNTPGLSSKLPPVLHPISGEPVFGEGGWGPDLISPLRQSTFKDDHVLNEIASNKVNLSKHNGVIHGVELTIPEKVKLQFMITHDVKLGSRNLHDALAHLMESSAYTKGSDGPDGRKAMLIKSMFHAFKQMGELRYLKLNPDVMQQVKDQYKSKAARMKDVAPPPTDDAVENSSVDLSIAGY